jgi:solute carrier family 35 (UDP-sugar transporter), member A1/2/3
MRDTLLRLDPCGVPQVYATSMAMLVTMVVSVAVFDLRPTLQLFLGIVTASISLALYYVQPQVLAATDSDEKLPK